MVAKGWAVEEWELLFNEYRLPVEKTVLEMDSSDGYNKKCKHKLGKRQR